MIPGPKGAVTVSMASLGKGRFLCHPDIDSGYPESTISKRGTLSQIMELAMKSPQIGEALFQSPDNWDFFARTMGIPEIVLPEAQSRRKAVAEIEILLQQSPVGPSPEELQRAEIQHASQTMVAHGAGGPPPPPFDPSSLLKPSIQPDELDYHAWEFEEMREFLSNWPKVQQQLNAGNQAGIQNVKLYALALQTIMQQQAMAAQQAEDARIAATNPKSTESWKPADKPAVSA